MGGSALVHARTHARTRTHMGRGLGPAVTHNPKVRQQTHGERGSDQLARGLVGGVGARGDDELDLEVGAPLGRGPARQVLGPKRLLLGGWGGPRDRRAEG